MTAIKDFTANEESSTTNGTPIFIQDSIQKRAFLRDHDPCDRPGYRNLSDRVLKEKMVRKYKTQVSCLWCGSYSITRFRKTNMCFCHKCRRRFRSLRK